MNRKIEKQIRKKSKNNRVCLSIFAFVMLLFVPFFVYASETKSDGNTTQVIEEENKTVRVGYFPYANFQEGGYGEHKQGAGYEYLQKISYITGWKYEYVYGSFKECLDMLADGEIDILGNVSYTPERAESIDYSTYAAGTERYWIYTREDHTDFMDGDPKQMNGCRIGVADGSYQKELLEKWLDSNQIQAEVVVCKGYDEMIEKLDADELDALVIPVLSVNSDFIAIANIGASDCYFGVSKSRPDLLKELNSAMEEINNTETDYSSKLYARYEGKAVINYALNKEEKQWLDAHENTIRVGYKPVPTDLRDMINTVLSIAKGYMENRDLNLYVSREKLKTPYVMADELRIREVLLNIISNAVKFTKDGGTISFAAENAPGNDENHIIVRYRISDTGIGMSEEFQTRIFDEFSQENGGARTSYKGTGLGMAIAKQYVDLMGGKIEVSSRKGIGSIFTVEIPLLIAEQILTEKEEKLRKDMDLHGLHVLLAEDNDLNAEIAAALLEEQGMIVTRTADGKSALAQFCNTAPGTFDLILMDIMMPEMNGYETTKAIRNLSERPDGKEIPIIAMTANAFAEDVQAALHAGMDDHVAKPVDMRILISVITKYIER
ncbi:response regulator [Blautia massiliensis (ex Durand et al. 2017)]|uniref:response regulator n=1 Tax=Blautia massiliensis (ex Durand et al. 2017) TaxID=1737424 RepID=UPI00156FD4A5|nr:response regulator [Blautia massiliensis (ex Durand et al. 2017)]NSG49150.1 response regulator [Blautia massiliensis (ex Durand et al. 2017)]NSL01035.1 response regulator [Blautia massiliensis (ex Durand et al. 2017)]